MTQNNLPIIIVITPAKSLHSSIGVGFNNQRQESGTMSLEFCLQQVPNTTNSAGASVLEAKEELPLGKNLLF